MASNFLQFAENSTNVYSTNEYDALNERSTGFQPNTVISSKAMNTAIKSATLVTTALMEVVSYSQGVDVGVDSQQSNVVSYIRAGLATLVNSNIFFNVTRQENQVNGDAYTIQVGNTGNIKTINITNAAYAYEAHDVSETINGIAISEIFESNGSTVKLATNANYATTSNTATNATNTSFTNTNFISLTSQTIASVVRWNDIPLTNGATVQVILATSSDLSTANIISFGLVCQSDGIYNSSIVVANSSMYYLEFGGGYAFLKRMTSFTESVNATNTELSTYRTLMYRIIK